MRKDTIRAKNSFIDINSSHTINSEWITKEEFLLRQSLLVSLYDCTQRFEVFRLMIEVPMKTQPLTKQANKKAPSFWEGAF